MTDPVTLLGAAKVIKRPLDDLYSSAKAGMKGRLNRWQASSNINNLYKKIQTIQKVKTIWQVEKEVNLKTFYYPSKLLVEGTRIEVNKIDKIPLSTNIIIQGTVGQGKSIFLRYLCSQELRLGKKIPVFIELRKIDSKTSLKDLVYSVLKSWNFDIEDELFDFFANSGKFVFLLDGFDEINSLYVQSVIFQLEEWSDKYGESRIIVTSRPDSGIERSAYFRVFRLAPLSTEDQKGIVAKLASSQDQEHSIIEAINNSSNDIKGLLTTPLMMTLLIVVYKSSQKVPEQFSEFYEDLFQTLLVRHDKSKPGYVRQKECKVNERKLQEIFEAFCFFSTQESLIDLSHEEIHRISDKAISMTSSICDSSSFIHDIVKLCCLIIEEGLEYHFVHKSVREFYSANFIKNRNDEFARKFYTLMLDQRKTEWQQELVFLSQIDKYRFSAYFLKPHIEHIATIHNINMQSDILKESDISLVSETDTKNFIVLLTVHTFSIKAIQYSGEDAHNFPGTYQPYDIAANLLFRTNESKKLLTIKYNQEQKDALRRYSAISKQAASTLEINAILFLEIISKKDEFEDCCKKEIRNLNQKYKEISDYIKREEEKIAILDL